MTPKRSILSEVPWSLVGLVVIVGLLEVYNLHSAAHSKDPDLFLKQLTWLGLGLGLAAVLRHTRLSVNGVGGLYRVYRRACTLGRGLISGLQRRWGAALAGLGWGTFSTV